MLCSAACVQHSSIFLFLFLQNYKLLLGEYNFLIFSSMQIQLKVPTAQIRISNVLTSVSKPFQVINDCCFLHVEVVWTLLGCLLSPSQFIFDSQGGHYQQAQTNMHLDATSTPANPPDVPVFVALYWFPPGLTILLHFAQLMTIVHTFSPFSFHNMFLARSACSLAPHSPQWEKESDGQRNGELRTKCYPHLSASAISVWMCVWIGVNVTSVVKHFERFVDWKKIHLPFSLWRSNEWRMQVGAWREKMVPCSQTKH